jgi:hypothetical protein
MQYAQRFEVTTASGNLGQPHRILARWTKRGFTRNQVVRIVDQANLLVGIETVIGDIKMECDGCLFTGLVDLDGKRT